jgi:DNA-directed RNA polymerase subunit RPC12/RpoP
MVEFPACPECGTEKTGSHNPDGGDCPECGYVFTIDELVTRYEPHEIAFTVKFRCRNCHRTFKLPFVAGDEIMCPPPNKNRQPKNAPNGLPVQVNLIGKEKTAYFKQLECPSCESTSSFEIIDRFPKRER